MVYILHREYECGLRAGLRKGLMQGVILGASQWGVEGKKNPARKRKPSRVSSRPVEQTKAPPVIVPMAPDTPEVLALIREGMSLPDRMVGRWTAGRSDADDVRSAAYEALVSTARSFEPLKEIPFVSWARLRMRGAIMDEMRKNGFFPKREYRRRVASGEYMPPLLGGDTLERVTVSYPIEEMLDEKRRVERHRRALFAGLPDKERQILEAVYVDGNDIQTAGKERLDCSKSWASRIHRSGVNRIAKRGKAA